jgi:3'(2'), 5'-bisphosphate nucleotidase
MCPAEMQVCLKADGSKRTSADEKVNEFLKTELKKQFPSFSVISEEDEKTHADRARLANPDVVLFDPVDGTDDLLNENGDYAVSILYVKNNTPRAAAIYLPAKDKLYIAEHGHGAYLRHKNKEIRLRVSVRSLEESVLTVSAKAHTTEKAESIKKMLGAKNYVLEGSRSVRICTVAEGKADWGFIDRTDAGEWDACGALILTEAGGGITAYDGSSLAYNKSEPYLRGGVVFTNGKFHSEARLRTREHLPLR